MLSNSNPKFLPEAKENEFLPPISPWTTFGGMFILFVLGLAVPVAAVVKYKVTVQGQAVVRPAGELRIVQAATEGQVTQIYVKENQAVKKGDRIATIDDSRLQTKKSQMQSNIGQAKLQGMQINAQINALNTQIRAETDRINRTIASAKAELSGRERAYQDKKITTVTELQEANANVKIAQEELHVGQAQLQSELANFNATVASLGAARTKSNRYEGVAKKGALSKNQMEEAQLAVNQQEQAVQAQEAVVKAQKQTIERLKQAVGAAIARRDGAKAALNPTDTEVAIASERIAQEKAAGEANKANVEKERLALIQQRIEIEKQLEREESELKQIEFDLNQTTITATDDGIISKLNLRNPGQTVRAGEEVVIIVPEKAPKVIKAAVSSESKDKIKVGQKVQMRVGACPYPDYGTLNGKVKTIAPDTTVSTRNDASNETNATSITAPGAFYEVTIEPEKLALGRTQKKCQIQLGMDGRADIITHEETVLQFFLRKARLITDL
ncbi:HlyD family efflux transporter periplasmic adaptor subunit [Plectonema cf. radiosum LEGE 06105]|uniref:HlyD family efflux transporter periplasmic adaptor subunit n=1 Tax=Plectonema cf. radiosum LEGE 06105 TaxID=945769 RepID=A0A8J7F809_9CYAN|nr:HlyD family efflux transporter periplasmic adaptor subunit [Plectonema radiosum]MBE9213774.1 HlyD family efflux transporter periplasmic adaptor subunit [Plectonema cf. radiosum LEGE 06105]